MKLLLERWKRFLKENEQPEIEAMLELDPWSFDQTRQGWRSLPTVSDQIEAIRTYLTSPNSGKDKENPEGKIADQEIIKWHLGQVLAIRDNGGDKEEAIKWMQQSENPEDPQWNNYVNATIAFLNGNREEFDEHAKGENYNSDTLKRLSDGWGKSYKEAY